MKLSYTRGQAEEGFGPWCRLAASGVIGIEENFTLFCQRFVREVVKTMCFVVRPHTVRKSFFADVRCPQGGRAIYEIFVTSKESQIHVHCVQGSDNGAFVGSRGVGFMVIPHNSVLCSAEGSKNPRRGAVAAEGSKIHEKSTKVFWGRGGPFLRRLSCSRHQFSEIAAGVSFVAWNLGGKAQFRSTWGGCLWKTFPKYMYIVSGRESSVESVNV